MRDGTCVVQQDCTPLGEFCGAPSACTAPWGTSCDQNDINCTYSPGTDWNADGTFTFHAIETLDGSDGVVCIRNDGTGCEFRACE